MYFKSFHKKVLLISLAIIMVIFTALAVNIRYTTADAQAWDNYDIITDSDGNFEGINIKNSPRGSLSVAIPAGSATASGFGLVTFELGQINSSETTGLLLQIDRRHATADQGPRLFLEDENGVLYRFSNSTKREDVFIRENGTKTAFISDSWRYTFTSGVCGTLYVPWTVLTATGTKTPDGTGTPPSANSPIVAGTVFTRLHFGLEMRNTGWHGLNRATAFGTIGTVTVNGADVTAKEILNVAELNYSVNENDTEAGVNLADLTKGTKVYARHSISGSFVFDESPEIIAATIDIHSWSRTSAELTVRYVNTENEEIQSSITEIIAYVSIQGGFPYTISAPAIAGYQFNEQSADLTGMLNNNSTLTLIYEELDAPILTAIYVDGQGNVIKDSESLFAEYNAISGICSYDVEAAAIFGYTFVSADKPLQGTFTEDTTITFTYALNFDNFDVITSNGQFKGINIKNSMTGALIADVTTFNSTTGYGIITVELDDVDPSLSTGFLLQFARLDSGNAQVRMYLEADDGTMYRFFPGSNVPARNDVLILPDGSVSSVSSDATNQRHMFSSNQQGTLYISWDNVYRVGSTIPIAEDTVFTKFHFGREMRFESSVNNPIALGTIAAVKVDGNSVIVEELVNFTQLSFTAEADNTNSDINLKDYQNGTKVYIKHWATGTNVFDTDASIFNITLGIWDLSRIPPNITIKYVDENGIDIMPSTIQQAVYEASGSTYSIVPTMITGYEFDYADKPLSGDISYDMVITLVYNLDSQHRYHLAASYSNGNIYINVVDGIATFEYQYWIRTKIIADATGGNEGIMRYIWNLAAPYSNNSGISLNVLNEEYLIDDYYEIIVRIRDNQGSFVKELHGRYLKEDLGQIVINTVTVNEKSKEPLYVVNKTDGIFTVSTSDNVSENIIYSIYEGTSFIESNSTGIFEIDVSQMKEGYYNYTIKAVNGISDDKKTIRVYIFGEYKANQIAVIKSLTGTSEADGDTTFVIELKYADGSNLKIEDTVNYNINLVSQYSQANFVEYRYGLEEQLQAVYNVNYNNTYGVYRVRGSVSRTGISQEDDFAIIYYSGYVRESSLSMSSSQYVYNAGETITITASGTIQEGYEGDLYFAFFREDAGGWVMIRNYSTDKQLNWTPSRPGIYKILVRIKAQDSVTYEKETSKDYLINGHGLAGNISITAYDYQGDETLIFEAGKPYIILADYAGAEDVLYMFTVFNKNQGLNYINYYTTSNSILFVPNKMDDYVITVRVININNFGYKDVSKNISINT